jgi:hypothetical protein
MGFIVGSTALDLHLADFEQLVIRTARGATDINFPVTVWGHRRDVYCFFLSSYRAISASGRCAGDRFADNIKRQVIDFAKLDARLTHIHLLNRLLVSLLQLLLLALILIGASHVKGVVSLLGRQSEIAKGLTAVSVRIIFNGDLAAGHPPVHGFRVTLGKVLEDGFTNGGDDFSPFRGKFYQILVS